MLDVIGVGFGRTGTASLKTALEHLGFGPCYHMVECVAQPRRFERWARALAGAPDWDEVFAGYRATVDFPGTGFWYEIADRYPRAKIILTTRDPDAWYESNFDTIYQASHREEPPRGMDPQMWKTLMRPLVDRLVWDGIFGGAFADRDHAIQVFTEHNEEVKRAVPANRLLVFEAADGWGPLCEFLDVEVPSEPYPAINQRKSNLIARVIAGNGLPRVGER